MEKFEEDERIRQQEEKPRMKPTKAPKREGNLTKQRAVACPTCHSPAGDFCKSVGARGKVAGAIMRTSCHNARITAAGLPLRDFSKSHKPAPKPSEIRKARANRRRSEAMKLSWKRRRGLVELKKLMGTPSIVEWVSPAGLMCDVIEILKLKPELLGTSAINDRWTVTASRTIPEGFNISIVKR